MVLAPASPGALASDLAVAKRCCGSPGGQPRARARGRLWYAVAMHLPRVHLKFMEFLAILAAATCWLALAGPPAAAAPAPALPAALAPADSAPLQLRYRCDGPAALFWVASALSGDAMMDLPAWRAWWQLHPGSSAATHSREQKAIEAFGRLRASYRGRFLDAEPRANPWVPVPPPSSHRLDVRFAAVFLGAQTAEQLRQRAEVLLTDADQAVLQEIAGVWLPKLEAISAAQGERCGFAAAFEQHARHAGLGQFLLRAARLFGAEATGELVVQFVPAPGGELLRGRRLGNYLVIEVKAGQRPEHRSDVVVHEACHWLQERGGMDDDPQLIGALFGAAAGRAARAWELLAEGTATALGQGLWLQESAPAAFERSLAVGRSWYADAPIDTFAKELAPILRRGLQEGLALQALAPQIAAAAPAPGRELAAQLHRYVLLSDHRDSQWLAKAWFAQVPPRAVWRADLGEAATWARGAKGATLVVVATWAELKGVDLGVLGIASPPAGFRRRAAVFSGDRAGGAQLLVMVAPAIAALGPAVEGLSRRDWPSAGWSALPISARQPD